MLLPAGLVHLTVRASGPLGVRLKTSRRVLYEAVLSDDHEASDVGRLEHDFVSFGEPTEVQLEALGGPVQLDELSFEAVAESALAEQTSGARALVRPTPWPARGAAMPGWVPASTQRLSQAFRDIRGWGANVVRVPVDPIGDYRIAKGLASSAAIDPLSFWAYFENEACRPWRSC